MTAVVHHHGPPIDSGAVPLVLLHAFPFDARMWDEVIARLDQVPVLAVDLPGFGDAAHSAEPEGATLESFADAVAEAVRGAGVSQAVMGGVSMGGYVLMALAERHRAMLAGVALLDTKAEEDTADAAAGRLAMARRVLEEGAGAAAGMVDAVLGPTTRQQRPEVVQRVQAWLTGAAPQAIAAGQRAMAMRPDRLHVLESLSVTALVLYGSQDAITGAKEHEAMAAALGTEAVVVDGAGHLSAVEAPDQVAAALTDLYRRSTQGTQAGPA